MRQTVPTAEWLIFLGTITGIKSFNDSKVRNASRNDVSIGLNFYVVRPASSSIQSRTAASFGREALRAAETI